jgi:tetratricopeptide (TPR) repeat protein
VPVALGRPEEAIKQHLVAIDDARSVGDRLVELAAVNNLGEAYLGGQRPDDAAEAFARAQRLATELDDAFERGRALAGSGRVALAAGDPAGAHSDLHASLAHFDESMPEAAAVRATLAELGRSGAG